MPARIRFGIVGPGWRTEFFLRIAQLLPDRFEVVAVLTRNPQRGAALTQQWDVPTVATLPELLAYDAMQFVVVSVSQASAPAVIRAVVEHGWPVLTETPPAPSLAELAALHALVAQGARIQVAEQYQFQPMHAARIALARSGRLGFVNHVQLSVAHGYHGISLIRRLLGIGFENASVQAQRLEAQIVAGRGRTDPPPPETLVASTQTIALLRFGERSALYDFAGEQYFSWIRRPRVLVRGTHGEIEQHSLRYLQDARTPIYQTLKRVDAGLEGNLEGFHHQGIMVGDEWIYRNPVVPGRLADDEIAVAACLLGMDRYVRTGEEFYGLADAAQDQYLSLLMEQALREKRIVESEMQIWTPNEKADLFQAGVNGIS